MSCLSKALTTLCIAVIIISCGPAIHLLDSDKQDGNINYEINDYYGCCGCEAKFLNTFSGKQLKEQIVYSYNCYNPGAATKFIFQYNKQGKCIGADRYVATPETDYTIPLTSFERGFFRRVDTVELLRPFDRSVTLSKIKGFRKPNGQDIVHAFPLIKRGSRLPVH